MSIFSYMEKSSVTIEVSKVCMRNMHIEEGIQYFLSIILLVTLDELLFYKIRNTELFTLDNSNSEDIKLSHYSFST